MFYTVASSTAADPEVCIRLVTLGNSRIHVMVDQEYYPELDDELLTANERLTCFSKAIERILGKVKEVYSSYVQGHQYFDKYLVVSERVPIRTDRPSVREPRTDGNHAPIGQSQNDGSSDNSQYILVCE